MSSPRALPVQGRPAGVEDVAADESAVALDRHAAHGDAARVEESPAHKRLVAADHHVAEREVAGAVAHAAAEVGAATRDRDARECHRAALDIEDPALAAAGDREPFRAGADD